MRSEPCRAARPPKAGHGRRVAAVLALATALLTACGGGGGPPDQTQALPKQISGYATPDGRTLEVADIIVKGAVGPSRGNAFTGNPSRVYAVSTQQLSPPYMIRSEASGTTGVALDDGRVNLTQLTTLLTIALLGQTAADAFADYGVASAEQIALINPAEIARAQADATDFLQNTVHVTVQSGGASFITDPFTPVVGDPMWDTLVALNARIAELGPDAYAALVSDFERRQHRCRRSQVKVAVGGSTTRFCPATTATTREAGDTTVLDNVYTQASGETLTVRTRGDTVLDATYVDAGGASYTCSGSGCSGLVLGPAAFDTTRSVTLTSVLLVGSGGSGGNAMATGRTATTVPDVTLGDLPCFVGVLHKIAPDGSVASECVDNSTASFVFATSGSVGGQEGASAYADYTTNGISLVLKGSDVVSLTAMVPSADGSTTVTAACRGTGCQGITVGAPTVDTNLGITETDTRAVSFDGTPLYTVAADGSLTAEVAVRLKASLRLIYFSGVAYAYATPEDEPACSGPLAIVKLVPDDTPQWAYVVCAFDGYGPSYTPLDGGGIEIGFNGQVVIDTDTDGHVVKARFSAYHGGGSVGEYFGCDGLADCSGVQVAAPDAEGNRHVAIVGASFHNVAYDGFASGPRTGRIDATFDAIPGF